MKLDYWNDVKALIYEIEKKGVHLILWQYPVIKKLDPWQSDSIHALDEKYVIEKK